MKKLYILFCLKYVVYLIRYYLNLCKSFFGKGIYFDVEVINLYYGGYKIVGM